MKQEKVKLTKYVSVNIPILPNFIIHEDGPRRECVPVKMFTERELRKIGKAWTDLLVKKSTAAHKAQGMGE